MPGLPAPTAPQTPAPLGTPTVTEIGYYSDWQRTKPITGNVAPGDTIHIKIVFSEGMSLVIADDETARPVLYHRIDGTLTRFKIAGFGATDADFISGDCKPFKTQAVYFGKYTVTPTDTGSFTIAVGKKSTDRQGNELAAFYTHPTHLQLGETATETSAETPVGATAPSVVEVGYYSNQALTRELTPTDRIRTGDTIYTKVVFSEAMQHTVATDDTARPVLSYRIGDVETQYHMLPHRSGGTRFRSGTCKPKGTGTFTFICKYSVAADDIGEFTLSVGQLTVNAEGTPLAEVYVHDTALLLGQPREVEDIHLSDNRIDENQPIGSIVGTFSVPVGKHLSYSVVEGTRDFTVTDGTKLVTNRVFNHEVQWGYEITVRETDRDTNASLEKPYTLFINDLNEAPTDLRLTNNTFYRADGIGTKIGRLVITDEDREDAHQVRITQGGAYVGYDNGYLRVLQLFDQSTKEIAVEVTDPAGLAYTETFEIRMKERPTQSSEPSETTPASQDDAPSDASTETMEPSEPAHPDDDLPPGDVGGI